MPVMDEGAELFLECVAGFGHVLADAGRRDLKKFRDHRRGMLFEEVQHSNLSPYRRKTTDHAYAVIRRLPQQRYIRRVELSTLIALGKFGPKPVEIRGAPDAIDPHVLAHPA